MSARQIRGRATSVARPKRPTRRRRRPDGKPPATAGKPPATAGKPPATASVRNANAGLVAKARAVRAMAHAPYSGFRVGAAVRDERGRVHVGCNVENASYGLTVCAERNAVAAAVAAGARKVRAIAIATPTRPPSPPCGACRQVLAEVAAAELVVLLAGPRGAADATTLGALLPATFRLRPRRRG